MHEESKRMHVGFHRWSSSATVSLRPVGADGLMSGAQGGGVSAAQGVAPRLTT